MKIWALDEMRALERLFNLEAPAADKVVTARAIVKSALANVEKPKRWRHRNGGTYVELYRGYFEWNQIPCVIYKSERTGGIWVRPESEFMDGRFTLIDDNEYCADCEAAAIHAYSDMTTPGFFNPKCSKHRGPV